MPLIIALPRESRPGERRVALDPSRVERLLQQGLQVHIEADCGHSASFQDEAYVGATVLDSFADVVRRADITVKVVCPTLDEIALLPKGSVLVCIMAAFQHLDEIRALRERQITVLGMDLLPRTTRAQPMDALSSQATVAGYKAALLAAELSPRLFPMLTTAAGTIRPSRVLVVGAGVAGLQAIATARRLGAQVQGYDIRRAAKEQIESLGARMIDTGVEVEGAGGMARSLRSDEKQIQHDVLAQHLARAHVVICAAALPGRKAPRIITEDMVDGMLPESVIVDMAAPTGGNCELTRIGEHYYHHNTLIVGPVNLPSHGAVHASEMYAHNICNMLQLIIVNKQLQLDPQDEIIARCILLHDGQINHPNTAKLLKEPHVTFGSVTEEAAEMPDDTSGWLKDEEDADEEQAESSSDSVSASNDSASGKSDSAVRVGSGSGDRMGNKTGEKGAGEKASGGQSFDGQSTDGQSTGARLAQSDPSGSKAEASSQAGAQTDKSAGAVNDFGPSDSAVDEQELRDLAALEDADAEGLIAQARTAAEEQDSAKGEAHAEQPRDELILIDGVGPALQERLYSFGYRQWWQLAEMDDDSIERLSMQLELDNEILEQDWRGQAQRLMEKGE